MKIRTRIMTNNDIRGALSELADVELFYKSITGRDCTEQEEALDYIRVLRGIALSILSIPHNAQDTAAEEVKPSTQAPAAALPAAAGGPKTGRSSEQPGSWFFNPQGCKSAVAWVNAKLTEAEASLLSANDTVTEIEKVAFPFLKRCIEASMVPNKVKTMNDRIKRLREITDSPNKEFDRLITELQNAYVNLNVEIIESLLPQLSDLLKFRKSLKMSADQREEVQKFERLVASSFEGLPALQEAHTHYQQIKARVEEIEASLKQNAELDARAELGTILKDLVQQRKDEISDFDGIQGAPVFKKAMTLLRSIPKK